ncbi:MAG TPA: protein kinase [Chthoniobacterales bacterium]|nr:protein kinase [Chthoniobacterales bacterium]
MATEAMTPERWQRVKTTLADALERTDGDEREAFLAVTCADDSALRSEVQSLLDQPDDEFESCATTSGLAHPDPIRSGNAGRRIGSYELLRELGSGGMGTVWLARRADRQFEKLVAVKLLKRGTDTEEVLRRFESERQILARLTHPNIAQLFDAGTTEGGLPFFVMEYVEGTRLTDFVRERQLSVADRLRLFRKICAAVQFAHQNLVVHRDLKPGNILVTAGGEPKLLDFGIAKLLAPGDDAWEQTIAGRERLTPAYASPEQVRGEPVTTVSDVYALGALLYEILSDRTAHEFSRPQPSPTELLRVVCEREIARPSLRAEPPEMRRQLRGDLDNIVLRAMAKDPARRYSSAGNLADDLQRYLDGRPVRARADTVRYRACKFVHRNKAGVAAVAVVLLTLLGGTIATGWQAHIANRERTRAERRFNELRGFANGFLFELDDAIVQRPTQARKILVQLAQGYLDGLSQEAAGDLSLQRELATAYQKLGDVKSELHNANIGDTAGALESYRKALALRETLVAANASAALRLELAVSYRRYGDVLAKTGNTAAALISYQKTLPLLEATEGGSTSWAARMELAACHEVTARMLLRTGDIPGAVAGHERALQVIDTLLREKPADPDARLEQARNYSSLGYVSAERGENEEALQHYRASLAIVESVAAADATNPKLARHLMKNHQWMGTALRDYHELAGALIEYGKAHAMCELARRRDPANVQTRNDLADIQHNVGQTLFLQGDAAGALEHARLARESYESVALADSLNIHAQRQVLVAETEIAQALALSGDVPSALSKLRETLTAVQRLAAQDRMNREFQRDEARCETKIGELLAQSGDLENARERFDTALPIFETLAARSPLSALAANDLAAVRQSLARMEP